MKIFILLFFCFSTSLSFASQDVLKCLGQEEKFYHKKRLGGALLKINKSLISEMLQISETLEIKPKYVSEVCNSKKFSESVQLLKLILREKDNLFIFKSAPGDVVQRSQDERAIKEIINRSAFLFIKLINHIQSDFKQANCVIKEIPQIRTFYHSARYILEDEGIEKLLPEPNQINSIFDALFSKKLREKCKSQLNSKTKM